MTPDEGEKRQGDGGVADGLVKVVRIAGPRALGEAHRQDLAAAPSPVDALLDRVVVEFAKAFKALRIATCVGPDGAVVDFLGEIRELTRVLLAKGRRGEVEAMSRCEFAVDDNHPQRRTVAVDMALDVATIRVKGVAPQHGVNGIVKEVGDYFKYGRARERRDGSVNHYLTGKFAPAKEGEVLAILDNSGNHGVNGVDCLGKTIRARNGTPVFVSVGNGVRKVTQDGGKVQLVSERTGVVVPLYDKMGQLRSIDVRESVKIGEVGIREGGHVAARGAAGRAAELHVDDTSVASVPRAFVIRTTGVVNVADTIFGEVTGGAINAEMINAAGKTIAARESITVRRSVQASTLHAATILIGQGKIPGSVINAPFCVRHSFTAVNLKLLGNNTLRLGNDLLDGKTPETGLNLRCGDNSFRGEDLFAERPQLQASQEELGGQFSGSMAAIREGLLAQVKKQQRLGRTDLDFKKLLAAIVAAGQVFEQCPVEEEEQRAMQLVNALMDLGVRDTLSFLNWFRDRKRLQGELDAVEARLAAISPPLEVEMNGVTVNDGARLVISCWKDSILLRRVEEELIVSREAPAEELHRSATGGSPFAFAVSFDYETGRLACTVTPS